MKQLNKLEFDKGDYNMSKELIVLVILCAVAVILGIDALKWRANEMRELRKNHPERFDEYGRFIPYKTGRVYSPNLPINAPGLPHPENK